MTFEASNIVGTDVGYFTQVVDSNGNVVHTGAAVSALRDELIPRESFGAPGTYTLRVVLSSNNDIAGERTIRLQHPSAYYTISEPTSSTTWVAGGAAAVAWTATNVAGDASVELFNGDQVENYNLIFLCFCFV